MVFGLGKKKKKKEEGEAEEDKEEGASEEKEEGKDKGKDKGKEEGAKEKKESEGGEAPAEGEEGAPKKSKKKIIILGILALVVLVGGAGGAYFAGLFGGGDEHATKAEEGAAKAVFYTMPEFLVNLNATGKSSSFLKTTIILELQNQTDVLTVEANLPRLMDAFNTYLRELRSSDLAGSAGIQRLREELLLRSNKALAPTKINDILFKEIVVQ